jgi:hypothetical protein
MWDIETPVNETPLQHEQRALRHNILCDGSFYGCLNRSGRNRLFWYGNRHALTREPRRWKDRLGSLFGFGGFASFAPCSDSGVSLRNGLLVAPVYLEPIWHCGKVYGRRSPAVVIVNGDLHSLSRLRRNVATGVSRADPSPTTLNVRLLQFNPLQSLKYVASNGGESENSGPSSQSPRPPYQRLLTYAKWATIGGSLGVAYSFLLSGIRRSIFASDNRQNKLSALVLFLLGICLSILGYVALWLNL